jgi:hypothetical protein
MKLSLLAILLFSSQVIADVVRDDHKFVDQGQTMPEERVLNPQLAFDPANPPIIYFYLGEPLAINFEREIDHCHGETELLTTFKKDSDKSANEPLKRLHLKIKKDSLFKVKS